MLDDEIGPRAEPDLPFQGLLDLALDAVVLEDRDDPPVQRHARLVGAVEPGDEVRDMMKLLLPVHDDLVDAAVDLVAQDAPQQPHVLVEKAGGGLKGGVVLDLPPEREQRLHVSGQGLLVHPLRGGPDDDAEVLALQVPCEVPQALALLLARDAARDPGLPPAGDQDQVAPRKGQARCHTRPLVLAGRLGHLDHQLLIGDDLHPLGVVEVEKRVPALPDADEGGVDAGKHALDPCLVDLPGLLMVPHTLYEYLRKPPTLQDRDARLLVLQGVGDDLAV